MPKKESKIKVISVKKEGDNIILFEVMKGNQKISDRCKISGITNIVKTQKTNPMVDVYSAVLNSLGESNETATNK